VKDIIDTSFTDQEGFTANYILRYERPIADSNYKLKYAYLVTDKKNTIEVTDNNLRFVKLVFPITYKGTWEGNKYITATNTNDPNNFYSGWLYKYLDYDKPLTLDSTSFEKTITIVQNNILEGDTSVNTPTVLTDYSFSRERYARNIGLVEKNVASIKKDFAISNGKRRGFIMRMQAINYN
jgi:hypothetical protein